MALEKKPSKIAVLTSGGDLPGMNPCIRAVVRAWLARARVSSASTTASKA